MVSPRRPEEARALLQLSLDTALTHQLDAQASTARPHLSDHGLRQDHYNEALGHLDQTLELARRTGNRGIEWFALSEMTYALAMLGRWDEALGRFAEIPDEPIGTQSDFGSPLTGVLEIHLHRGELGLAQNLLARYDDLSRGSTDIQIQCTYQGAIAAVRLAEGRHDAALAAAKQAFAARETLGIASQGTKQGFVHALEAALALGDDATANELLDVVEALQPGLRPPLLEATVHRFRAHLAGTDPSADRHFTAAEAQLAAHELPFHLAVVQLEHGEWLLARGRPDDAQPLLAEAHDTFAHLDAKPWLERLSTAEATAPAEMPA